MSRHQKLILAVVVVLCLGLGFGSAPVQAAPEPVTYGKEVAGTIGEEDLTYAFKGATDDIVIITMNRDIKVSGNKLVPGLRVMQGTKTIATTKEHYVYSEAKLVLTLPKAGEYTVVATGKNQDKATAGEFTLLLSKAERLADNKTASKSFAGTGPTHYFAADAQSAFTVTFKKSESKVKLELGVHTIKGNGSLSLVGKISGTETVGGVIMIEPQEPALYLVTIDEALFSFGTKDAKAAYVIRYDIATQ